MSHLAALTLTATLSLSTGWCWGHATARIRHIPIGTLPSQDEAAIRAADEQLITEWRAQLDTLPTLPDQPEDHTA